MRDVNASEIEAAPICRGLSPEEVAVLARHLEATTHAAGETLYREDEPEPDDLLLILEGEIDIQTRNRLPDETPLGIRLAPGDVAGILGFVSGETHVGTATAAGDCRLARLSREQFDHICARHPALAIAILRFLVLALDRFSGTLLERYKESLSFMHGAYRR